MITDFKSLVDLIIIRILDPLLILIMSLALVYFLSGVLKYVAHGGDQAKREEGKNVMIYGIIALAVMVSVWGLVQILTDTFGISSTIPLLPV